MNTFELAIEFIADQRYRVLAEDCSDGHIAFRFRMNTIHLWANDKDEHFFLMTLPNFTNVTKDNIALVKENCYQVNLEAKLVKLYIIDDVIVAAAEVYYLAEDDFKFQMLNSLKHLVAAKAMYGRLEEQESGVS